MLMFTLVLIFNFIALALTAFTAVSRPTRFNLLTVLIALCGFMLALYQFDTQQFNPLVLGITSLLNLFLITRLAGIMGSKNHHGDK